ncbi:family 1 glycosylhydrolase, partial [Bacillus pumilus]|uniref:family 1 glycosylhydrolase n=1 Tax=Bacillus pumilus TaxID=1408 RepID=UPI003C191A64
NHHMLVAPAKAMTLCHQTSPEAEIGPAPNLALSYPAPTKPENVLAAANYNAIRNWLYLDMAVFVRYNNLAWAYMKEKDILPVIEEGDMEIGKSAKPDVIAFNYYTSQTGEA